MNNTVKEFYYIFVYYTISNIKKMFSCITTITDLISIIFKRLLILFTSVENLAYIYTHIFLLHCITLYIQNTKYIFMAFYTNNMLFWHFPCIPHTKLPLKKKTTIYTQMSTFLLLNHSLIHLRASLFTAVTIQPFNHKKKREKKI